MNSATLMTLREACGLTRSDLAGLIKSPKRPGEFIRERTVSYWENGKSFIPEDVANFIEDLDAALNIMVADFFNHSDDDTTGGLIRFRNVDDLYRLCPELVDMPVTCHAALINRIRLRLDHAVVIEWYGEEND